jgi:UDP-N-acetylglucosamine 2-epimerase (non-hydrolysing)
MVAVQGDTTTTFAVSLAAFYQGVPVVHLEAGLRTNNPLSPFPEEINRRLTTQLSALHLAPTATSRDNLLAENVDPARVIVTGNTVIDALHWTVASRQPYGNAVLEQELDANGRPVLLVTAHRRESWGAPMEGIGRALARIAARHPEYLLVFPVHRNPLVRQAILPAVERMANVRIVEPLPYGGFARLMNRSSLILTDSGGVQEEGPSLGKPVLVMRDTTERPEAVTAGTVRLVGTDEEVLVREVCRLIEDRAAYDVMGHAVNPYGDGHAATRSVDALKHFFGLGPRPAEFAVPGPGADVLVDLTHPVPVSSARATTVTPPRPAVVTSLQPTR